jgi:hypothetical protein
MLGGVTEPIISRDEATALLCNVADIAVVMRSIDELLFPEDDDGEAEADEG